MQTHWFGVFIYFKCHFSFSFLLSVDHSFVSFREWSADSWVNTNGTNSMTSIRNTIGTNLNNWIITLKTASYFFLSYACLAFGQLRYLLLRSLTAVLITICINTLVRVYILIYILVLKLMVWMYFERYKLVFVLDLSPVNLFNIDK